MANITSFPIVTTDRKVSELDPGLCPILCGDVGLVGSTSGVVSEYGVRKALDTYLDTCVSGQNLGIGLGIYTETLSGKVNLKSLVFNSDRFSAAIIDGTLTVDYNGTDRTVSVSQYIQGGAIQDMTNIEDFTDEELITIDPTVGDMQSHSDYKNSQVHVLKDNSALVYWGASDAAPNNILENPAAMRKGKTNLLTGEEIIPSPTDIVGYPIADYMHVKATTQNSLAQAASNITNPTATFWAAEGTAITASKQRIHIDMGSSVLIDQIKYQNKIITPTEGVKNFTIWGSNTATVTESVTFTNTTPIDYVTYTGTDVAEGDVVIFENIVGSTGVITHDATGRTQKYYVRNPNTVLKRFNIAILPTGTAYENVVANGTGTMTRAIYSSPITVNILHDDPYSSGGDYIMLTNHGLTTGTPVIFTTASAGTIVANKVYYVLELKSTDPQYADRANRFQLSIIPFSATIFNLTADETGKIMKTLSFGLMNDLYWNADTNWTQLTTIPTQFAESTSNPDIRYIEIPGNVTSYRYYALKCTDNWGHGTIMAMDKIEFHGQIANKNPSDIKKIVYGCSNLYVIYNDNTIYCMGDNRSGQLGVGRLGTAANPGIQYELTPVLKAGVSEAVTFSTTPTDYVNYTGIALSEGDKVVFSIATPTGVEKNVVYFVRNPSSTTFNISRSVQGTLEVFAVGTGTMQRVTPMTDVKDVYFNTRSITDYYFPIVNPPSHSYMAAIIDNSGNLYTCGNNDHGQLGLGDILTRTVFTKVTMPGGVNVKYVYPAGSGYVDHGCVTYILDTAGQMYACGFNNLGFLGLGYSSPSPYYVTTPQHITALAGETIVKILKCAAWTIGITTLVLTASGKVYGWGNNNMGVLGLGNGNLTNVTTPTVIYEYTPGELISYYPPSDLISVRATSNAGASYIPWNSTDPNTSLIGSYSTNQWLSDGGKKTNQRFHMDLGKQKTITKIYYENGHSSGGATWTLGAQHFTLWGTNTDQISKGTVTAAIDDIFTLTSHGLLDGAAVIFSNIVGIKTIIAGTVYYIKKLSDDTFNIYPTVALITKVNITAAGTATMTQSIFETVYWDRDENWTQIDGAMTMDQHSTSNLPDPKYITLVNSTSYRYYAFKFADNYGHATYLGVRRIELQAENIYGVATDIQMPQDAWYDHLAFAGILMTNKRLLMAGCNRHRILGRDIGGDGTATSYITKYQEIQTDLDISRFWILTQYKVSQGCVLALTTDNKLYSWGNNNEAPYWQLSIGRAVSADIQARIPTEIVLPITVTGQLYTCTPTGYCVTTTSYVNPTYDVNYSRAGFQLILNNGDRWGFGSNIYGTLDNSGLPGYERDNTYIKWNVPTKMNGSQIKPEVI